MTKKEIAYIRKLIEKYDGYAAEEEAAAKEAPDKESRAECYMQARISSSKSLTLYNLLIDLGIT